MYSETKYQPWVQVGWDYVSQHSTNPVNRNNGRELVFACLTGHRNAIKFQGSYSRRDS